MLFMVIEHFKNEDPVPVYRRFRESGRLLPAGVTYVASWVTSDLACCYQVMDCVDRAALDRWMDRWADLVNFEIRPVITSSEAAIQVP